MALCEVVRNLEVNPSFILPCSATGREQRQLSKLGDSVGDERFAQAATADNPLSF
jgi:hypothetical protein